MKYTSTSFRFFTAALVSIVALSSSVKAQEVYSQIVGAISIDLPAESDVIVAFPFKQSAEFRGVLESASENGSVTLTVIADSLTSGAFDSQSGVPTHYAVIKTGVQKGTHLDITSNTASTIVLSGGTSTGLAHGDEILVYPH